LRILKSAPVVWIRAKWRLHIAVILITLTIIVVVAKVLTFALRSGDTYVVGYWNLPQYSRMGMDLFAIPGAFIRLLNGTAIYGGSFQEYGPYATSFVNHPFVAVAVGSWMVALPPMISYSIFTLISMAILVWSGAIIARMTPDKHPFIKWSTWAVIFAAYPTFRMLFLGQIHGVTVLALALILADLMRLARDDADVRTGHKLHGLFWGLLLSLLSKPIAILFIPTLLLLRETRGTLLKALAIYTAISAAFLFIPALNPEYANIAHWLGKIKESGVTHLGSSDPNLAFGSLGGKGIFGLPTTMAYRLSGLSPVLFKIPLALCLVPTLFLSLIKNPSDRARIAMLTVISWTFGYYLSFNEVYIHHFPTLLPLISFVAILRVEDGNRARRRLYGAALAFAMFYYVPTPFFLFSDGDPLSHLTTWRAMRILPTMAMYVLFLGVLSSEIVDLMRTGGVSAPRFRSTQLGSRSQGSDRC
jgi:hypothetical protein